MSILLDSFSIDPTAFVAQDTILNGNITIAARVVVHPRATIRADTAPIIIGSDCIIEENVTIINRGRKPMLLGHHNHFQIAARIESQSIGDYNTFSPRSYVPATIAIQDWTTISAGTAVLLDPFHVAPATTTPPSSSGASTTEERETANIVIETLPSNIIVYGSDSQRRLWTGVGVEQQKALYEKHLTYLLEILPKKNEQRIFRPS